MADLYLMTPKTVLGLELDGDPSAEAVLTGGSFADLAVDPDEPDCVYVASEDQGVCWSHDAGKNWEQGAAGLDGAKLSAVAVSGADRSGGLGAVYVGSEPSALFRSEDGGRRFEEVTALQEVPSRKDWSFPPRPHTHHVCSLAADRQDPALIYVGIELGGVMCSNDRGESFADHIRDADDDPHTLRTHPGAPGRIYEGGGCYFAESLDRGHSWHHDLDGIPEEIRYFYSLAVDSGDPDTILIAAARDPFTGHARDSTGAWSTIYRRSGDQLWHEVTAGLPDRKGTRMGWLAADSKAGGTFYYVTVPGELYRSVDSGVSWELVPIVWPDGLDAEEVRRVATAG